MHLKRELNPDFLNNFLDYEFTIKNYSEYYIKNANSTCCDFLNFINKKYNLKIDNLKNFKIENLRIINKEDIYDYIFYLAEKNIKISSIYTKINYLRTFFNFLYKERKYYLFINPMVNLKELNFKKYKDNNLPKILTISECKKLLSKNFYNFDKEIDVRDYCILTLFLNTGLRVSELTSINISNIDFNENKLTVIGKGNKERTVYLNKACITTIKEYLKFKEESKNSNDILFISNKNSKLCTTTVERLLNKRLKNSNINRNDITVHSLRHTFATIIYKENKDLLVLSNILGHSSINTTKIYTKLYDKDVEETMNLNPLSDYII